MQITGFLTYSSFHILNYSRKLYFGVVSFTYTPKPFLQPEINIESNHELIIEKARKVSGNIREPFAVTKKLVSWVYRKVEKKPVITVPSALEVLKTRVGDCNEHAVLLTALLRASGIQPGCVWELYMPVENSFTMPGTKLSWENGYPWMQP